jgi:hypothetical protein
MIYLVHLYCDSLYSLQVKLYEGKLLSIMTCALVGVMLLVRIFFIDTSLHNLWSCLSSSVFTWGQARSKLGGVDTSILHHYFIS